MANIFARLQGSLPGFGAVSGRHARVADPRFGAFLAEVAEPTPARRAAPLPRVRAPRPGHILQAGLIAAVLAGTVVVAPGALSAAQDGSSARYTVALRDADARDDVLRSHTTLAPQSLVDTDAVHGFVVEMTPSEARAVGADERVAYVETSFSTTTRSHGWGPLSTVAGVHLPEVHLPHVDWSTLADVLWWRS